MTENLHVVALIPTDPAAADAVSAGIAELAEATRTEEGCLSYLAYRSATVPGLWITVEEWRDQSDLDAHFATPHVAKALELLGGSLIGEVAVHPLIPA